MKVSLVRASEKAALEAENARLRAALEDVRDQACVMARSAMNGTGETAAVGLSYLGRLASDALDRNS